MAQDMLRLERRLCSTELALVAGLRAAKFDLTDMLDTHAGQTGHRAVNGMPTALQIDPR
jgi:hypothetical protein